jgi:hypothetical protein
MVIINGRKDLLWMSSKLLEVGTGEDIVEEVNLSSILVGISMVGIEAQSSRKLTRAQESAGGACGFDIFVLIY